MITNRDLDIIKLLDSNGVATPKQLTSTFFKSYKTGLNRLNYLTNLGIVKRVSASIYLNNQSYQDYGFISLTKKDFLYVLGETLSNVRKSVIPLDIIKHNLLCNDIFSRIFRIIGINVLNYSFEKYNKNYLTDLAPDITILGKEFKLGIEVERTLKRNAFRYLNKFTFYADSDYTHVLYVCGSKEIHQSISKYIKHFKFIGSTFLTFEKDILSHNQQLSDFINTKYK